MQQDVSLIDLDANHLEHLNMMYAVRRHPMVGCYLRGAPPGTFADHERYLQNVGPNRRFFIVRVDSNLCGYCQLTIGSDQIEFGMAMHPDFSNRGIGSSALSLLLKKLSLDQDLKSKSIILYVKATNARAINLYSKYGFSIVGSQNEHGEYLMKMVTT